MINTKEEFLKSFLPAKVKTLDYTQINLDITDLSISDILRNIHKSYPLNSRARNTIISGTSVVAVLCKTSIIEPMKGVFIIVSNDDLEFELVSFNYIILCVAENKIRTDKSICDVIDSITKYLVNNFEGVIPNLADFYRKYVYDPYELDEDDYETDDGFFR